MTERWERKEATTNAAREVRKGREPAVGTTTPVLCLQNEPELAGLRGQGIL